MHPLSHCSTTSTSSFLIVTTLHGHIITILFLFNFTTFLFHRHHSRSYCRSALSSSLFGSGSSSARLILTNSLSIDNSIKMILKLLIIFLDTTLFHFQHLNNPVSLFQKHLILYKNLNKYNFLKSIQSLKFIKLNKHFSTFHIIQKTIVNNCFIYLVLNVFSYHLLEEINII